MPVDQAFNLLKKYDIPVPPYIIVQSAKELADRKDELQYPVVVKVISNEIVHKTEAGAVRLNILNHSSLVDVIKEFEKRFGTVAKGFLIQKMVDKGVELTIGGVRDPVFGPLVMFGSGGIFIELFKDVSFRLAPVDRQEALDLIKETKVYRLLQGFRGLPKVDIYKVVNLIIKVSNLIWDNKNISELDINPLIVGDDFAYAVDVRIVFKEEETK
jgi:acetyl-CoA synthetase (ADP-forming)